MSMRSQLANWIATAMIVVGMLAIGLAWNGAANWDCLQCQFPYLLSGGLPGLGLVISGVAVLLVQAIRTIGAERTYQLAVVNRSAARVAVLMQEAGIVATPARLRRPGGSPVEEGRIAGVAPHEVTEHFEEPDLDWGAVLTEQSHTGLVLQEREEVPVGEPSGKSGGEPGEEIVVAGRSSFHRPSCYLVVNRTDLDELTREEAEQDGLNPCRICKP